MSMSSPAAIFHHGLRCTKIHKKSAVAVPSTTSLSALTSSLTSTASDAADETLAPTQRVEPLFNSLDTPSTQEIKVPPPAVETTASQTSQTADVAPVVAATTTPTAVTTTTAVPNIPSVAPANSLPSTEDEVNTKILSSSHDAAYEVTALPSRVTPNFSSPSYSPTIPVHTPIPTINSTTSFTLVSTTTGSVPSQTHSLREPPASSEDNKGSASLRTILGSALGAAAFLVLAILICFLILRNRRKTKGGQSVGGSEKPLHNGRKSPDSGAGLYHEYRSNASKVSDTSSTRSMYNYIPNAPLMPNYEDHHDPNQQQPSHHSSPYSNPAEISPTMRENAYHIRNTVRYPFLDDPQHTGRPSFPRRPASLPLSFASSESHRRPGIPFVRDEGSMYGSDRSLGSTIFLPGRSSSGSSLRRFSYGASAAELGLCSPTESVARSSTRSDPFDLEIPARVMDRNSAATITRAQV
ncbi:hypothetical protein P170DRAFT_233473 [Aspergillus steynii IBT 23096]|uniref:Uncharacterized protein n=1 Tax=Aspergillus steynii IBT 23096 TaxID=1392250 RepID=A0A2I2G2G8_9EURO|nr:uncharacterized protein P170DRAFT_233473 [Aspergillus steynii IBT 23096]PLB47065.1 hypothetical protein P170DRAFT_233473 [Aspergillus steynii IBT 23096]